MRSAGVVHAQAGLNSSKATPSSWTISIVSLTGYEGRPVPRPRWSTGGSVGLRLQVVKRAIYPLLFVLWGCSGTVEVASSSILVVNDGRVGAVSSDQTLLAYYTNVTADDGATLSVMPLPSGNSVKVSDNAGGATFGNSRDVLFFEASPTPATDAPTSVGKLWIWKPTLGAAMEVSTGFDIPSRVCPGSERRPLHRQSGADLEEDDGILALRPHR